MLFEENSMQSGKREKIFKLRSMTHAAWVNKICKMTHNAQKFPTANKFYEFDYLFFKNQFLLNVTNNMLTEILKVLGSSASRWCSRFWNPKIETISQIFIKRELQIL